MVIGHSPSDTHSDPYRALDFVLCPIRKLFTQENQTLMETIKQLAILERRFTETFITAVHVDWMTPLSTDFTFLRNISSMTPQQMALSLTKVDVSLFNRLAVQDFIEPHSTPRVEIGRKWQTLASDSEACVIVDKQLGSIISKVATVSDLYTISVFVVRLTLSIEFAFNEKLHFSHCSVDRPSTRRFCQSDFEFVMASHRPCE